MASGGGCAAQTLARALALALPLLGGGERAGEGGRLALPLLEGSERAGEGGRLALPLLGPARERGRAGGGQWEGRAL